MPLIRGGEAIGAILIRRVDVCPFSDRQVELVETFADQAVIAIENARLFEAEQASKREQQEFLEYQTATSDVLSVINRSTFDLETVLETLVKSAAQLCAADMVGIVRPKNEKYHHVVGYGFPPGFDDYMQTVPMTVDGAR